MVVLTCKPSIVMTSKGMDERKGINSRQHSMTKRKMSTEQLLPSNNVHLYCYYEQ